MVFATTGFLALSIAFIVLARHFSIQHRRGWAVVSRTIPVFILAGFVFAALAPIAFVAGAGIGLLWLAATAARLTPTRTTT